ncbi:MAG: hypothetical protein V4577_25730 [Bacteroidota bacterium]
MAAYSKYPTEEQEKFVKAFLEAQEIYFVKDDDQEELPPHVLEGIAQGQVDIAAGRTITHEEFIKKLGLHK